MTGRFTPPPDPIRTGRVIVGPPPVLPAQTSLRPRPLDETRARLLPPRIVNRSVIYDHPVSIPPPRFENRMKDLKEGVEQGNPPITVRPHVEEKPIPRFDEARDRERIHRDFTVRKTIKEPVRESPRSFSPPQRERETPSPLIKPRPTPPVRPVEPGKKAPARGSEPKQLYRKPPPPLRQQEAR